MMADVRMAQPDLMPTGDEQDEIDVSRFNFSPSSIKASADLLSAMANARRLEILSLLVEGEMNVGDLCKETGLAQSALSQHLAVLRRERLVSTRRAAQVIFYNCQSPKALAVLNAMDKLFGGGEQQANAL